MTAKWTHPDSVTGEPELRERQRRISQLSSPKVSRINSWQAGARYQD
jgi:hypothetical protein